MTGRERILAVLAGHDADHLPCMPITMMFAADILGRQVRTVCPATTESWRMRKSRQPRCSASTMFQLFPIPPAKQPIYGARIQWYEDQPPAIVEEEALFDDKSALARVRTLRNMLSGGRMEDRIRGIELLRERAGKELFVEGWVEGPCAEAADLRGISRLMIDFSDDPAFVHDLFESHTGELRIRFAAAQIKAGADIIGVGDAAASLVGPRIYNEFVWPWEKRLVDAIHANGGRVRLHICGNTRRILEGMGKLGCDLVDIDYPVDMKLARAETGPEQTLAGNLDPVRDVRNGSPETISQSLEILRRQTGPRWIVAAGCEIVRDTPHENVKALVNFSKTYPSGLPDISCQRDC